MGVREKLNKTPSIAIAFAAVAFVIALVVLWRIVPRKGGPESGIGGPRIPTRAFYTNDNGATYFEDDFNKIVPFDKDGKPAYMAWVYKCDDGEPFVGVIGRHTAMGKELIEEELAKPEQERAKTIYYDKSRNYMEIKKVKADDRSWILNDELGDKLRKEVECPSGGPAKIVEP
jgi:hypothetical protein